MVSLSQKNLVLSLMVTPSPTVTPLKFDDHMKEPLPILTLFPIVAPSLRYSATLGDENGSQDKISMQPLFQFKVGSPSTSELATNLDIVWAHIIRVRPWALTTGIKARMLDAENL